MIVVQPNLTVHEVRSAATAIVRQQAEMVSPKGRAPYKVGHCQSDGKKGTCRARINGRRIIAHVRETEDDYIIWLEGIL